MTAVGPPDCPITTFPLIRSDFDAFIRVSRNKRRTSSVPVKAEAFYGVGPAGPTPGYVLPDQAQPALKSGFLGQTVSGHGLKMEDPLQPEQSPYTRLLNGGRRRNSAERNPNHGG